MANIGHKNGGKIIQIVAIAHSTYKKRAEWHFVGRVEWDDGSHMRDPSAVYDIPPYALCTPENGDNSDLDTAITGLNNYLREHGDWTEKNGWVPREKTGRAEFML